MKVTLFVIFYLSSCIAFLSATPLDDYINKPDSSYKWSVENVYRGVGYTGYAIKLTSQTWLNPNAVDKYVWQHWLNVCVPDKVKLNTGAIYIDGGSNPLGDAPSSLFEVVDILCVSSNAISAHLQQIPNQPIYFHNSTKRRSEDALIAYTWGYFMNDTKNNAEYLARLPMTKAVVRAMDAIQEFVNTLNPNIPRVYDFLLAGGSKRGWTTWTTAAVDKRVKIIVPIVMPIVGMHDIIDEMYRVYGEWSFALEDYVEEKVLKYFGKPEFKELEKIVDPLTYIKRYTMIKYVVVAAGDEFFLPDSTKFFWDKLVGPSFLRVLPNAEHTTIGSSISALLSAETLLQRYANKRPLPQFDFKLTYGNETARIVARTSGPFRPTVVKKWWATTLSSEKRDFRLLTCKSPLCVNLVWWKSEIISESSPGSGVYMAIQEKPESGWTGFMIEATYNFNYTDSSTLNPIQEFKVTTSVNVVPDILPFQSCIVTDSCQPLLFFGADGLCV